jgi:SAM-dependent methyltransferase
MSATQNTPAVRNTSFGQEGLSTLERIGVWLSHRAVARVVHGYARPSLLDLGSGYGCRLIGHFQPRLGAATAVDVALDPALAGRERLTLVESTIEKAWPRLARASFDIVTMINVLEHVRDPLAVLTEAGARLRPGGTLVVNVPTWLGKGVHEWQAFRLGLSSAIEIDDHKHYFDKRDLWPQLVRAGFKPSRIRLRYHKLRLNLFATARQP